MKSQTAANVMQIAGFSGIRTAVRQFRDGAEVSVHLRVVGVAEPHGIIVVATRHGQCDKRKTLIVKKLQSNGRLERGQAA